MSNEKLPILAETDQEQLQLKIRLVQIELAQIQQKTRAFEGVLRTHLSDLIVEAQELHILYKAIKKQKKEKRQEQKKRGKNYKEPKGIVNTAAKKQSTVSLEDEQEKKRLYREALLHVHPDKFSMNESDSAAATEITSKLIEIYKTESLDVLQAYHAHIFRGNTGITLGDSADEVLVLAKVPHSCVDPRAPHGANYLQNELESLGKELEAAKSNQLYKVIIEYANPLTFVDELKEYYDDRIFRLKKRTRKGLR